jgi:hypothetical protein
MCNETEVYREYMAERALLERIAFSANCDRAEVTPVLGESPIHTGVPVTAVEAAMLDERLSEHRANPTVGRPWSEVHPDVFDGHK